MKLVDPNGEEALCPDNPPKNKSSMTAYYKQQITQTKGVEKFGYILKYTGEKIGFDEQEFVDKAAPYLETAASNLPIVSEFNNAKTIIRGEDMFDNKADISDKNLVFISVITKGANHSTKYITKKIQNEGSKLMNEVGNFGVRVQQSIKTYRNQKEKQKKYK